MYTQQDYNSATELYFRAAVKMDKAAAKGKPIGTYSRDKADASALAKTIDAKLVRYTSVVDIEQNKYGIITEQEITITDLRCQLADCKKAISDLLLAIAKDNINQSESASILKQAQKYII